MRKTSQDRYRQSMDLPDLQQAIEDEIKNWMRDGLKDDKWIELHPGAKPFHPWFNKYKSLLPGNIVTDAMQAYDLPPEDAEVVLKWAQEVAQEYMQQKEQDALVLYMDYMACKFEDQVHMHQRYYGQYVDDWFREQVVQNMGGIERLKWAYHLDKHFNSIPLYEWQGWCGLLDNPTFRASLKKRGDFYSNSTVVCVVKEAARQAVEQVLQQEGTQTDAS